MFANQTGVQLINKARFNQHESNKDWVKRTGWEADAKESKQELLLTYLLVIRVIYIPFKQTYPAKAEKMQQEYHVALDMSL